ncbi:MAG TPA: AMP-binding protein, partial [Conexibacter sp.]|nr:AMP-binding protein [Conexibacter sp.]
MSTTVSATPQTLTDAVAAIVGARGEQLAVRDREGTVRCTWRELNDAAARVAAGLAGLGVGRDATVGLLLTNRPEFHVADLATVMLGAVPVSIYATSSPEQVAHVADDAGLRVLIVEAAFVATARAALAGRACALVVLDGDGGATEPGEVAWETLTASPPLPEPVAARPDDLLTIIYTSGTTGPPKGVELTHRNLLTATRVIGELNGIAAGGRVICWLPLAHIAERIASWYAPVLFGLEVTTCPDPRQIGAAPSAPELIEYFHTIGIPLAEIYGMSENCACCTCNPPGAIRVGTVGPALPGVELRIAGDGELLMRSETVMRGYRGLPQATAEAIDGDGWLRTGDVGSIDDDGYLRIVDRKKELIISAGGKNMSPANIEARVKSSSPLLGQAAVIGDMRPYNVALLVLDPDGAMAFCK